ncbi:DMT family transporter [Salinadaptatus halalkaliphilus]|uniref:DMT family transporter n=1 Tax=Salinadaptatus halalkaliphilus TaxID=2419781 RepID=A0A4S3TKK1_9EURY|nr:DMT family transporter [Salinadaptatus halalkaliphilus]
MAILAAVLLAVQNVLIRVATDGGDISDAIIVMMGVNLGFVAPLAAVLHYPAYGLSWEAVVAFAAAGIAGLVLGRICMFAGIEMIGASRTTPLVSASALVSTVLAVWLFGESVVTSHAVGIGLIVGGVAIISWVTAVDEESDPSIRNVGFALLFALGAAVFVGIEPILIRIGLDSGTPILVGLAVMMTTAFVSYAGYYRLSRNSFGSPFETSHTRWYVGAGLASTIGLLTYFGALASAPVVIAIPIIHTAPLIVLVLSIMFLPQRLERITWPLIAAAVIVVIGAALVSLAG